MQAGHALSNCEQSSSLQSAGPAAWLSRLCRPAAQLTLARREIHILGQSEHLIESMATPRLGADKELEESQKPLTIIAVREGASRDGGEQSVGSEAGWPPIWVPVWMCCILVGGEILAAACERVAACG
ncbi:hypothetical protein GLAREA_03343 [Glarea lozoyensis ATCC 20868]|uniref:Uncharacterized protein n=1 Tax=Glarea lozoyensis (strain ATCC 20868 / MF5171) TaxID=1116229 RepID=S3DEI5_GLAL2|nr:uncharacterized protein GLAREA_03343 [Glarea lozoyensis ATCC 20868]EPE30376.1 hypothetical protein GLAREA_03343 [Glarea lozoyensis ATCC 20868]